MAGGFNDNWVVHLNASSSFSPHVHGRKRTKTNRGKHVAAPLHGRKAGFQRLPGIAMKDAWGRRDMMQSMQSGRR